MAEQTPNPPVQEEELPPGAPPGSVEIGKIYALPDGKNFFVARKVPELDMIFVMSQLITAMTMAIKNQQGQQSPLIVVPHMGALPPPPKGKGL